MSGRLAIGVDIGGTKVAGGVVDEEGRILQRTRLLGAAMDVKQINGTFDRFLLRRGVHINNKQLSCQQRRGMLDKKLFQQNGNV